MTDFSKISTKDLEYIQSNQLGKVSTQALELLQTQIKMSEQNLDPSIPTELTGNDGRQERELGSFKSGVNTVADFLSMGASKPYKSRVTQEEIAQEAPLKVARALGDVPLKMISDLGSAAYAGLGTAADYLETNEFGKVDVPFGERMQNTISYTPSEKGQEYYNTVTDNLAALPATSQYSNISKFSQAEKSVGYTKRANEQIQKFVNKPLQEQLLEFTQNVKKNKIIKRSADEGYVFIPSAFDKPTAMERLKESAIGTTKASEQAQQTNQKVTNNLIRKYLGVEKSTPLDLDLTEKIRRQNGKVYAEIDNLPARPPKTKIVPRGLSGYGALSKKVDIEVTRSGRDILRDLKETRKGVQDYWTEFKVQRTVRARDSAVKLEKRVEELEDELLDIATYNNKSNLVPALKAARKQIAKAHLVEKALNDANGNVNAKVITKLAYDKRLIDKNVKTIAEMYKGFPTLTSVPKHATTSPFSVLDIGLTGYGFATQNFALAAPQVLKIFSNKSLPKKAVQQNMVRRQLDMPGPEIDLNLLGGERNAQGLKGLLQIPNTLINPLSIKEKTFNRAGLASLLSPYTREDK